MTCFRANMSLATKVDIVGDEANRAGGVSDRAVMK